MRRVAIFLIFCASISSQILAQEKCATVPYMQELFEKNGIPPQTAQFEKWIQQKIKQREQFRTSSSFGIPTLQIPVVVHIIYKDKINGEPEAIGEGSNIADSFILSQIQVLNDDFNRTNADANQTPADFLPVAGNMNIQFVLAKQTPQGLASNGIVRVNGHKNGWKYSEGNQLKALSHWPSEDYLNLWVVKMSDAFVGYAQFPISNLPGLEDFQNGLAATDGVAIDYRCFGVGSEDPDYNLGRTATHEVAHFFGLRHIWGDEGDCSGTDYVSDTPNQEDETTDCASFIHPIADACSSAKMYQNYMDYSDDVCMNLFTQGQIERMSTILNDINVPRRNSLLTSHGLQEPNCGANPTYDVAILSVVQPGSVTCDYTPTLRLSIENLSCPIVTNLKVDYEINGGVTQSLTVSGISLYSEGGATTIDFDGMTLIDGENTVTLRIATVNNEPDAVLANSETSFTVDVSTNVDVAILSIDEPGPVTCNDNPNLLLKVKNMGCPTISRVKVEYEINNGPTQTVTISDLNITNSTEATIDARAINLSTGENIVSVRIVEVNDGPDSDESNNESTVTIIHDTATDFIPLIKNFNNNLIAPWVSANPTTETLWNAESQQARFPAETSGVGEESWLVSPVLDFRNATEAGLFFQSTYDWSGPNEKLRILTSANCGDSWIETGYEIEGLALGLLSDEKQYVSLSSLVGNDNIRIAFVATSASGNNLDLDNIEFTTTDDSTPADPEDKPYYAYRDEQGTLLVKFGLPEREKVDLTLVDMMGHEIFRAKLYDILNQTVPVGSGNIPAGLYILRLQIGKKYYATRVYMSL